MSEPAKWDAKEWAKWALDFIAMSGPLPLYAGRAFDPLEDANDLALVKDECVRRRANVFYQREGNYHLYKLFVAGRGTFHTAPTGEGATENLAVLLAAHELEKK